MGDRCEIFRQETVQEEFNSQEKIWLDITKKCSSKNTCFFKGDRPLLSLTELGEKSRITIILGNFVNES